MIGQRGRRRVDGPDSAALDPTHRQVGSLVGLYLRLEVETIGAMANTLRDLRRSEAPCRSNNVDRLEKARLSGTVWTQNEMTPRPRLPDRLLEVAEIRNGKSRQHNRPKSGPRSELAADVVTKRWRCHELLKRCTRKAEFAVLVTRRPSVPCRRVRTGRRLPLAVVAKRRRCLEMLK